MTEWFAKDYISYKKSYTKSDTADFLGLTRHLPVNQILLKNRSRKQSATVLAWWFDSFCHLGQQAFSSNSVDQYLVCSAPVVLAICWLIDTNVTWSLMQVLILYRLNVHRHLGCGMWFLCRKVNSSLRDSTLILLASILCRLHNLFAIGLNDCMHRTYCVLFRVCINQVMYIECVWLHDSGGLYGTHLFARWIMYTEVGRLISASLIARFMWPTWGPSWTDRTQMSPCLSHELCYLGSYVTNAWCS